MSFLIKVSIMKIKKHILIPLMVLLLFGSMDAMAAIEQAIQVKGKVVDNIGEPVIGANVVVKGTTTGVITSIDGSFCHRRCKKVLLLWYLLSVIYLRK